MNTPLLLCAGVAALFALLAGICYRRTQRAEGEKRQLARALATSELNETGLQARLDSQSQLLAKKAQEQDLLAAILDHLPHAVWARDGNLRLRYCNAAYAQASGRKREEILAEDAALVEQADRAAAHQIAVTARKTETPQKAKFRVVIDGRRRLLEVNEHPLTDGSLVGYARDRTELDLLKRDLKRREEIELSVLERVSFGIAILGSDMRLNFFNQAYAHIWGFDEEFLHGQPHLTEMLGWLRDHRRLPEQADYMAFRRQRVKKFEKLMEPEEENHYLPDGRTLRSTTHPNPFGGVIQIYEDISDRLQIERTYNTLLAVQRETLDNLHEGIAVFGADGRLRLCNAAYAQIWHLRLPWLDDKPHVQEIVERARHLIDIPDEEWPEYRDVVVAMTTERESSSGRLERADGRVIDWRKAPLTDGSCVFSYIDATASARAAEALRQRNEALQTADRLKSEFIANISYDLRTPLNAIIGFSELLLQQYRGEVNAHQQDYLRSIVSSAEQLTALIDDMIDLASIEAGYMQLSPSEVEVKELLRSLDSLWRKRAESRDILFTVVSPDDIGTTWCDERRLRQALFNLLSNAFRFTPDGGLIELAAERKDEKLLLRVSDNGIGIPRDERDALLGLPSFGRVARGRRRSAGAGVGLLLAKSLLEMHGGWLELESQVNRGTIATCHLPAEGIATQETSASAESESL